MVGLGFYEATAQLIPLLLVVMTVEARWFRIMDFLPTARRQERFTFYVVLVYVAFGEGIALGVLYFERDFFGAPVFVVTTLVLQFGTMLGIAWRAEMVEKITDKRKEIALLEEQVREKKRLQEQLQRLEKEERSGA